MKTEKLSGSIWVNKDTFTQLFNAGFLGWGKSSVENPIELTITAKIPERKREFTEGELINIIKGWFATESSMDKYIGLIFKEVE